MILRFGCGWRWRIIWQWPTGQMAWFFWGKQSSFWGPGHVGWRLGPLTLWHYGNG